MYGDIMGVNLSSYPRIRVHLPGHTHTHVYFSINRIDKEQSKLFKHACKFYPRIDEEEPQSGLGS